MPTACMHAVDACPPEKKINNLKGKVKTTSSTLSTFLLISFQALLSLSTMQHHVGGLVYDPSLGYELQDETRVRSKQAQSLKGRAVNGTQEVDNPI